MLDENGLIDVFFDFTANVLKTDYTREQLRQSLADRLQKMVPEILNRMAEITPFITTEVSTYAPIIGDAKTCYELGLFRGAVVLTGVAAENFAMDLYSKVNLRRDGINLKKKLFKRPRAEQVIDILFLDGAISRSSRDRLHRIRRKRNEYVHPDSEVTTSQKMQKDALFVLNTFHEILSTRFSERFYFEDGQIYPR